MSTQQGLLFLLFFLFLLPLSFLFSYKKADSFSYILDLMADISVFRACVAVAMKDALTGCVYAGSEGWP